LEFPEKLVFIVIFLVKEDDLIARTFTVLGRVIGVALKRTWGSWNSYPVEAETFGEIPLRLRKAYEAFYYPL